MSSSTAGASHVIAGFRYQLLQSVWALLNLRENERLLLEVSEDFTIESATGATDAQVKNSQAAAGAPGYSLQSSDIRAVLTRFWDASASSRADRRLLFIARGGAVLERGFSFPGNVPGLRYWTAAALDADTGPIRRALAAIFADGPLGSWVACEPSDDELRSRLLRRVMWQLEDIPADALAEQIRDKVMAVYATRNLPVNAARQAVRGLTDFATEVASRPKAQDRTLGRLDLESLLGEAAGNALLAQNMAAPNAPSGRNVLIDDLADQTFAVDRDAAVGDLITNARGRPLLWLHGAHGVGKSVLARLFARRSGGKWIVLDLWPVRQDGVAAITAWRDLLRIAEEERVDGVILDDMDQEPAAVLKTRLAEFARSLGARGGRVIVTSHQPPPPSVLAEAGPGAAMAAIAPYFDETDLFDLVRRAPAPPPATMNAWAMMVRVTTGGGHPLLAVANVASLRARGWPQDALSKDFTTPSEAIQLTREESRRRLLDDLRQLDEARSLDAGQLLRRVACLFDSADEKLILRLAMSPPVLKSGGDAFAVLKGSWLEILPHGQLRVSPLITDVNSDVPPEEVKHWRRIAAEHWLVTRALDERTLPLCFWNAFLGEHNWVLTKLCETMQTMGREKLLAAAPLLSPMTLLRTDGPLYGGNPITAAYLRVLQFDVAEATQQTEVARQAAARLLIELDDLDEVPRSLLTVTCGSKVAMSSEADIPPALLIDYIGRVRAAFPIAEKYLGTAVNNYRPLLPRQFRADMDLADFLFASAIVRQIKGSEDELETYRALNGVAVEARNRLIDAASLVYDGPSVFVNSGWSRDQLADGDMASALQIYREIQKIAATWRRPDIEIEVACAISVILDEGIGRLSDAIHEIDKAISRFGEVPALLRQKSKVLGHDGRHDEAADILISIEDTVGAESPLERTLALRDGGVSAGKAGRFIEACRLFEKARAGLGTSRPELAVGLRVEKALAEWRAGKLADALLTAAEALDAVADFEPGSSKQAERSHQYARGIVGLFWRETQCRGDKRPAPFTFGQPSHIELESAELIGADLKPLADNWRILAAVEAQADLDVGIEAKSIAKQSGPLLLSIESAVLTNRYASSIKSGDLVAALRAGAAVVNVIRLVRRRAVTKEGGRFEPAAFLVPVPRDLLDDDGSRQGVQSVLVDLMIWQASKNGLDAEFFEALEKAAMSVFGRHGAIDEVFGAAAAPEHVNPASVLIVVLAGGIGIRTEQVEQDPAIRFRRDLMVVAHLGLSFARHILGDSVACWVIAGWQWVGDQQRFMLRDPMHTMAPIDAITGDLGRRKLSDAANVLVAARDAVQHNFPESWFDLLKGIAEPKN